jgi:hypothetical protein
VTVQQGSSWGCGNCVVGCFSIERLLNSWQTCRWSTCFSETTDRGTDRTLGHRATLHSHSYQPQPIMLHLRHTWVKARPL